VQIPVKRLAVFSFVCGFCHSLKAVAEHLKIGHDHFLLTAPLQFIIYEFTSTIAHLMLNTKKKHVYLFPKSSFGVSVSYKWCRFNVVLNLHHSSSQGIIANPRNFLNHNSRSMLKQFQV
jgi:hypothetical protein